MITPAHGPAADAYRDLYLDPATGLLRNLVGARTQAELDQAVANLTAAAGYELRLHPPSGDVGLAHLQEIHHRLHCGIYPFAGQLRAADPAWSVPFTPAAAIGAHAAEVFAVLAEENQFRGLDPGLFAERMAYLFVELAEMRPFPAGSALAARALLTQLADAAGYHIGWQYLDARVYAAATRLALYGDADPLRIVLSAVTHPHQPVYGTPEQIAQTLRATAGHVAAAARDLTDQAHHATGLDRPAGPNEAVLTTQRDRLLADLAAAGRAGGTPAGAADDLRGHLDRLTAGWDQRLAAARDADLRQAGDQDFLARHLAARGRDLNTAAALVADGHLTPEQAAAPLRATLPSLTAGPPAAALTTHAAQPTPPPRRGPRL